MESGHGAHGQVEDLLRRQLNNEALPIRALLHVPNRSHLEQKGKITPSPLHCVSHRAATSTTRAIGFEP